MVDDYRPDIDQEPIEGSEEDFLLTEVPVEAMHDYIPDADDSGFRAFAQLAQGDLDGSLKQVIARRQDEGLDTQIFEVTEGVGPVSLQTLLVINNEDVARKVFEHEGISMIRSEPLEKTGLGHEKILGTNQLTEMDPQEAAELGDLLDKLLSNTNLRSHIPEVAAIFLRKLRESSLNAPSLTGPLPKNILIKDVEELMQYAGIDVLNSTILGGTIEADQQKLIRNMSKKLMGFYKAALGLQKMGVKIENVPGFKGITEMFWEGLRLDIIHPRVLERIYDARQGTLKNTDITSGMILNSGLAEVIYNMDDKYFKEFWYLLNDKEDIEGANEYLNRFVESSETYDMLMKIYANNVIFIFAGMETTATGLTHMAKKLVRDLKLQDWLAQGIIDYVEAHREEGKTRIATLIQAIQKGHQFPEVDTFAMESLMKNPPVPWVTRRVIQDFTVEYNGQLVNIPAGTELAISTYGIPFIVGSRKCIGSSFALKEIGTFLPLLLYLYKLEEDPDSNPRRVIGPTDSLRGLKIRGTLREHTSLPLAA